MTRAGWGVIVYALLLGSIGVAAAVTFLNGLPAAAAVFTPLLTWLGARMLAGHAVSGFVAGALIMLTGLVSGYLMIATGNWAPGILLIAGFLVLFGIIAGLFSSLE